MKYKLFISDYDGTLGGVPSNTIDAETVSAIKEYEKKGGKFVICSGRMFSSIQAIAKSVGLDGIAVAFQGAVIRDINSGDFLLDGGLSAKQAMMVIDELKKEKILLLMYIGESLYYELDDYTKNYYKYAEEYAKMLNTTAIRVESLKEEVIKSNKTITKIVGLCEPEKAESITKTYSNKYRDFNIMINSGANTLVESINADYSKGQAVKFLSKYFNIPLDQVITIGDSTNDIPLVKGEWHGVAVGDAKEELKKVAKEITVNFSEKPVLYLLKKYCLD